MSLTIRKKVFLGTVTVSLSFILISILVMVRFLGQIADAEITHNLQTGKVAYERFTLLRYDLMTAQARSMAQTPYLQAVMNISDVDARTVFSTAEDLHRVGGTNLMLVVDAQGKLLADLDDSLLFGQELLPFPGVETGLKGGDYNGIWQCRDNLYRVALTPIITGNQVVGLLLLGGLLDAVAATDLRDNDAVQGFVCVAQDITELKHAEEQLRHSAFHDALTGLPNRVMFMEQLERSMIRAKRHRDYWFAVLFLDFDDFKVVNDSLGHIVGDKLLIAIARKLEACLRAGDTLARFGKEHLVVGTGYSSLSYLHRLPVDTLKIDRSFISRMGVDNDDSEIIRTIVTLAHNLGMGVIAEGVETPEQLARLVAMGCEYGQGYFFSRPVDSTAAKALIAASSELES